MPLECSEYPHSLLRYIAPPLVIIYVKEQLEEVLAMDSVRQMGREKTQCFIGISQLWIWIIVWRVQLTFWEFRFWALLPYVLVMLLWGCRGRVMLLFCPLSPCHVCWHSHACPVMWEWGRWDGVWLSELTFSIARKLVCAVGVWERAFHLEKEMYLW